MRAIWVSCLIFFITGQAFAWHTNTHLQMTRDALQLVPEEFRHFFQEHKKYVEAGITDPDQLVKDWQNHYYIPSDPPEGGGLDRIDKIIKVIETKFKAGNSPDVSKQLCYLAHYIGDLWSPESLIKKSTSTDIHFLQNNSLVVLFDGYKEPIPDIRAYLEERSKWRWRIENGKEFSPLLYSEAVNDIVRVWLTLWERTAGKTTEDRPAIYFEHVKGALNVNFQRLLQEEYMKQSDARHKMAYGASTEEERIKQLNELDAINQETARLKETVKPSEGTLTASNELRSTNNLMALMSPTPDFQILECSLKTVGDKAYLVSRVRNRGDQEILSLAFMYPNVKGPLALLTNLQPDQVAKVEAELPANSTKEQIQLVFSRPPEEE